MTNLNKSPMVLRGPWGFLLILSMMTAGSAAIAESGTPATPGKPKTFKAVPATKKNDSPTDKARSAKAGINWAQEIKNACLKWTRSGPDFTEFPSRMPDPDVKLPKATELDRFCSCLARNYWNIVQAKQGEFEGALEYYAKFFVKIYTPENKTTDVSEKDETGDGLFDSFYALEAVQSGCAKNSRYEYPRSEYSATE